MRKETQITFEQYTTLIKRLELHESFYWKWTKLQEQLKGELKRTINLLKSENRFLKRLILQKRGVKNGKIHKSI